MTTLVGKGDFACHHMIFRGSFVYVVGEMFYPFSHTSQGRGDVLDKGVQDVQWEEIQKCLLSLLIPIL